MQRITRAVQLILLVGILPLSASPLFAQADELVRHFDYDQKAPLAIKQIGVQHRERVDVYDITYPSLKGGGVPAYLVVPKGKGPFAAVIWGHWYWDNSSMRNRKQFFDEAIVLAQAGVVSLLTDGPVARPGHEEIKDPLDERNVTEFFQQVMDMRRGVDVLLARRDVDAKRIAYVGHSYNAGVGALLSGVDRRFKAFVLMAGSMSDEVGRQTKEFEEFRQKAGAEKVDAFIAKYSYLDQGKYVSHAAPAFVFLQYAKEKWLTPERARQYEKIVSEPKRFKLYDAPHALNAEARRDRIAFLTEQLKLKPLSAAAIAGIPDLYQPPEPNQ
ncbi:MAG TPA: acetylxylan esterase [Pyrinomonadaceae bacterium]|nr:acetylxylan esterase [Pyrinomonadaceae bacterium]